MREFADHCRLEETSNIYTRQAATGFFGLCLRKYRILENLQAPKKTEWKNCLCLTGTVSRDV